MTICGGEEGRRLGDDSKLVEHAKAVSMTMCSGKVSWSHAFVALRAAADLSGEADTERVQRAKALGHARLGSAVSWLVAIECKERFPTV